MKKDILRLGKDSITYGIGSFITRFIGLITLPLFTAYLTPEEYGVLAMLAMLTIIVQPVFSLGLSAAMGPSYFENDSASNKSKVIWSVFFINSVSALFLIFLAWSFPTLLGQLVRLPVEYSYLVSLSLTGTALTILVTSFTQRVQFEREARLYVVITIITALTAILISIYMVVFLGRGITGMIYGQVSGNLITFLAFLIIGLKATVPSVSLSMINELLKLGLPLVPSFAFLFILMHANKYMLEQHAGLDAVGIYSVGFNLGMAISIITSGAAAAWYPFFMRYINSQDQTKIIFGRTITYYFFSVGTLCVVFFLYAKPIINLLVNENFYVAYTVIGFVALAYFSQMLFNFLLPGLYYNKEVKYVSVIQGVAAIISLPLNYILIKAYSILGAGIGAFLGSLIMVVFLYLWNTIRKSKYPVINYEWKRIGHFIFLSISTYSLYTTLPSTSTLLEISKSSVFLILLILIVFLLLNEKEKTSILSNLRKAHSP